MMSSREEIFSWVEQQWDQKRSNIHVLNTVPLTKRDERFSLWKRKSKLACHRSYFVSWNTLWSFILYVKCETNFFLFILYVVEKYLEDIFKIKYLEDFFSSKMKKMKMLLLVSGSINSSKTNVRVVQVWILKPAVWLNLFSKIACKILVHPKSILVSFKPQDLI